LQRTTVTIDDELMSALDRYMKAGGHQNRSEPVRDLVRAGLLKERKADEDARNSLAALVYVYDHKTRQLSRKLVHDHHAHLELTLATLHVHLDAVTCLEVSVLKGPKSEVENFANHLIGERGVRYGRLIVVPAELADGERV